MLPTSRAHHVAALLTLKANCLDALTVKQCEIMINNVLLFSAINEETPYEQLLHYLSHANDRASVLCTKVQTKTGGASKRLEKRKLFPVYISVYNSQYHE